MISIELIVIIVLLIHWVADFVMQSHWQSVNKSKSNKALLSHTVTYSGIWFAALVFLLSPFVDDLYSVWILISRVIAPFVAITLVTHTITDYITSRIVRKYFDAGNFHNGFVVIGIDQILHYLQIYYTFKLVL